MQLGSISPWFKLDIFRKVAIRLPGADEIGAKWSILGRTL
jgi:hypothetical protein